MHYFERNKVKQFSLYREIVHPVLFNKNEATGSWRYDGAMKSISNLRFAF